MTESRKNTNPIKKLYNRLEVFGFDRKYLKKTVFPDWWEDKIAREPAGYAQLLLILSRNLGIPYELLADGRRTLAFRNTAQAKYKTRKKTDEVNLKHSTKLAHRVAGLCLSAMDLRPLKKSFPVAGKLRRAILKTKPFVDFPSILKRVWDFGVPVLYMEKLPLKLDGMTFLVEDRPVIVLARGEKHSAKQLFYLAHEFGHIVRGHLKPDTILCDEQIQQNDSETSEKEANGFAVELLTGNQSSGSENFCKGVDVAHFCRKKAKEIHVDPGVIALNYAWEMQQRNPGRNPWGIAGKALNLIEPERQAIELLKKEMRTRLKLDRLTAESEDFVRRVLALE